MTPPLEPKGPASTLARLVAVVALLPCGRAPAADEIPREARCMLESYPEHLCRFEAGALVTCDGERIPWDDGREKTLWERFLEPDPEDVFVYPYPATDAWPPAPKDDPGIIRYEPLLVRMYGGTAREVEQRLVRVKWFGRSVRMAPGAAAALAKVAAELKKLPARQHKFFRKTAGTFNWRAIKGSDVRSLHSYGLAIDVGVPYADYWRWAGLDPKKFGPPAYRNRFPREVVEVFERHGFVWGGRWSWFDTMHFEYRPELLCARRDPASDPPGVPP